MALLIVAKTREFYHFSAFFGVVLCQTNLHWSSFWLKRLDWLNFTPKYVGKCKKCYYFVSTRGAIIYGQGLLYTWTDSLGTFFATFVIIKISVNDTNTICRSSKSITFPKIWRVWLKNWVCHAHFNFELLKGVAVLFSELCPSNFGQW